MTTAAEGALPAPLTPADCNLQDFAFMPLDVARLRDSDMAAYESPEACWAAVLLWSTAWHQVPAASLPDDDRFLAKAAGYGRVVKEWANVRGGALHGWIKCADGRLYHPVVAEKANESWHKKIHYAWEKECDRLRKANKKREQEGKEPLPFPPEPTLHSVQIPAERSGIPPEIRSNSAGNDRAFQNVAEQAEAAEQVGVASAAHELGTDNNNLTSKDDSSAIPAEIGSIPAERTDDSAGIQKSSTGIPPEKALKGQGEGQGQGEGEYKTTTTTSARDDFGGSRSAPLPVRVEVEQDENQPAIALAVKLRSWGVGATFTRPEVQDWIRDQVSLDILAEAITVARKHKGNAEIDPAYLVPIVNRLVGQSSDRRSAPRPPGQSQKFNFEGVDRSADVAAMEAGLAARGVTQADLDDDSPL